MRQWKHNERASEPEVFDEKVRAVCECYAKAQQLHEEGVHLISTDEKTGIQALERLHPALLLMQPGKRSRERQEYEYIRHGTRCLIANFEVATGRIIAPSIGPTRTNEDFASHIEKTIATDPDAGWIFVVDQLNIHQSEALVKLVAKELSIELNLDSKGNLKHITRRWLRGAPSWQIPPTASVLFTPRNTLPGSTR